MPAHSPSSLDRSLSHEIDLADRLEAAERLCDAHLVPGSLPYERLERSRGLLPRALREAIGRALLEARRTSHNHEILSQALEPDGQPRVHQRLRELASFLREADPGDRILRVEELIEDEAFGQAPVLATRLVVEQDAGVAATLARAVGYLGGEGTMVHLKRAARSPHAAVRFGAVEGLRHRTGSDAVRLLLERLGDREPGVRQLALEVISHRSPAALLKVLRSIPPGRCLETVRAGLRALDPWAEHPAVRDWARQLLTATDLEVVSRAAGLLRKAGDESWRHAEPRLASWPGEQARQVLAVLHSSPPGRPGGLPDTRAPGRPFGS